MTAKSRARKFNQRRNTDDAYALRLRQASDAAKAAREAARSRTRPADREPGEEGELRTIAEGLRLKSISLISADKAISGAGYLISTGGEEHFSAVEFTEVAAPRGLEPDTEYVVRANGGPAQTIRTPRAPDSVAASERGTAEASGQSPTEQESEPQGRPPAEARTFFQSLSDTEQLTKAINEEPLEVVDAVIAAQERADEEGAVRHTVHLEAVVKDVPTHVGSYTCYCEVAETHWKELGEI